MPKITLEDIQSNLPGKRYANYYMAKCPFHNDHHPSLLVGSSGYNCKTCGAKGSLETLWKHTSNRPEQEAVQASKDVTYNIFYKANGNLSDFLLKANDRLLRSETFMHYLNKRGLDSELALNLELGFVEGWYTIPILNRDGDYIGAVARAGSVLQEHTEKRFVIPKGQPPLLYIPDWRMWDSKEKVFVTFGMFDAISLYHLGYAASSPSSGKDSVNPEWFDDVEKEIIVVPDKGEDQTAWKLIHKLGIRAKLLRLPYGDDKKDPNDFLQKGLEDKLQEWIEMNSHKL